MKGIITVYCFSFLVTAACGWSQTSNVEFDPREMQQSSFSGSFLVAPPHLTDRFGNPLAAPPQGLPSDQFVYQRNCQIRELSGGEASASSSQLTKIPCTPAKTVDLNISITNPQDLPPGELAADISYNGWRIRISDDAEIRESLRFHLGWFGISNGGSAHADLLDFADDPVLSRAVKLGTLEIMVSENHGRHTVGSLVVRGGPKFSRFTDLTQREPGVNRIESVSFPMTGALPVASEYKNPEQFQFVPRKE